MTTARVTLPLDNLGCGGEALAIEQAIARLPGVSEVYINPLTEMAYVVYDPTRLRPEQLHAELERLGYGAPPPVARRESTVAITQPVVASWNPYRHMILGGLGLALIYSISLALAWLVPILSEITRLWETLLPGVHSATPWTLLLGLVEMFLFGAFGALGVAQLSHTVHSRVARP